MNDYDEYEVIDADTKKRIGRFNDLKSARNMAQGWANAPHGKRRSLEIWGVVITKTREQVETVTRTETEQRHQGDIPMKSGKKIDDFLIDKSARKRRRKRRSRR